jgi:excisionase family DNA binding protein
MEDRRTKAGTNNSLLSPKQLAAYLACSRAHATKLISDGTIPSFKLGTLRRIRKSDVDAYVERQLSKSEG